MNEKDITEKIREEATNNVNDNHHPIVEESVDSEPLTKDDVKEILQDEHKRSLKQGKKQKRKWIVLSIILVIIIILLLLWRGCTSNEVLTRHETSGGTEISAVNDDSDNPTMRVQLARIFTLQDDGSIKVDFINDVNNPYDQIFKLVDVDTTEEVYVSPIISQGEKFSSIPAEDAQSIDLSHPVIAQVISVVDGVEYGNGVNLNVDIQ